MDKLARFTSFGIEDDGCAVTPVTEVVEAPAEVNELEEIRVAAEAISLEAFGGVEALKNAISNVPALLSKVTGFISNKFSRDSNKMDFYKPTTIGRISANSNYLAYSKVRVFKSVGQKSKTIELVNVLRDGFDSVVYPFVKTDLVTAERTIAHFAANPFEMKSVRHQDIISKTLDASYKQNVKNLSACFDAKDTSSEAEFGVLYDRMADYQTVVKELSKLNEDVYKININDVLGLADRLNGSFSAIVNAIENSQPGYEVSPNTVKVLSETCYQLAALLEYYSVYLFKLRECTVAVKDTTDILK